MVDKSAMALSTAQIRTIDVMEKACSAISVLGEAFVISTFLFSGKFRKPINRLVFYATWGNILANVATLMGRSAINMGLESPLCQFQSFLIQWFMPADALWTFAMACNVWLSFFHHYDAPKLRSLEWKYLLLCYGIPFPPAFAFLFISTKSMGRAYGDALLWCWIGIEWDFLRVAAFYGPVWIVILLTFAIYIRVGAIIWKWRRQLMVLRKNSEQERQRMQLETGTSTPIDAIRRTDEVTIERGKIPDIGPYGELRDRPESVPPAPTPNSSLVTRIRSRASSIRHSRSKASSGTFANASKQANKSTIKYCKCALLFFMVLLVTWVPSTVNRIYTLVYPNEVIFGLDFAAAVVLPLQGFWNAIIYIATSVWACKCLWKETLVKCNLHTPVSEAIPMRREMRGLSFDSKGGARAESDTTSLKPGRTC